jgi:hypothetical protein
MTITFQRRKMTARQLVRQLYGKIPVRQPAVHAAIVEMIRRGWLTAFIPRPTEFDRMMVFVPQHNDFAAIIRCVDHRSIGVVPRGLIESRTGQRVESLGSGLILAHVGIGVTRIDGHNISIRGTNSGLAMMVQQTRRGPLEHISMETLVHATTGKRISRHRWNDDVRLRIALAFDEFNIDVPGVFDGELESVLQSRWLAPPPPPPPPSPPRAPHDDSLPPPVPPQPLDPEDPPF